MIKSREEIFWSRVKMGTSTECWKFKKYKNKKGYGIFWDGDKQVLSHRYAYEIHNSYKLTEREQVLHHCDTPACCNPSHLYVGTNADNMRDKALRSNIDPKKYTNTRTRLYDEEVWLIKKLYASGKITKTRIAKMFKVHRSTIWRYINGISAHTRGPCPK